MNKSLSTSWCISLYNTRESKLCVVGFRIIFICCLLKRVQNDE